MERIKLYLVFKGKKEIRNKKRKVKLSSFDRRPYCVSSQKAYSSSEDGGLPCQASLHVITR